MHALLQLNIAFMKTLYQLSGQSAVAIMTLAYQPKS
jgi:hypothetical protein